MSETNLLQSSLWTFPVHFYSQSKIRMVSCRRSLRNITISAFLRTNRTIFSLSLEAFCSLYQFSSRSVKLCWFTHQNIKTLYSGVFRRKHTLLPSVSLPEWLSNALQLSNITTSLILVTLEFIDRIAAMEILINTLILRLSQPTLLIFRTFFGVSFAWLKLPHHPYIKWAIR